MTMTTTDDRPARRHINRWADRVARRIHAHDPSRPVWDRQRFLCELWEDCPDYPPSAAVELADAFGAAVKAGRGNAARFRKELATRLGVTAGT